MTQHQQVNLDGLGHKDWPPEAFAIPEIAELSLVGNQLTEIPGNIGDLSNLWALMLSHNNISAISSEISRLKRLAILDISANRITRFPDSITELDNLCELRCSDNQLAELPTDIGNMRALRQLDLQNNCITHLPDSIGKLSNLTHLNLQGNPISSLPANMKELPKLQRVSLYEGQPEPLPIANLTKSWDLFISHASEDRDDVVTPLADLLAQGGLRVWLDSAEMHLGDSIRSKIDQGLSDSRFGVIVLSPSFLRKKWPLREMNALFSLEEDDQHSVLPIWHQLTLAEVKQFSPMLADRVAASTSEGLQAVATRITDAVLYAAHNSPATAFPTVTRRLVELLDGHPTNEAITNFLTQHPRIVSAIFGGPTRSDKAQAVPGLPGILAIRPAWSLNCIQCNYIVPGPPLTQIFSRNLGLEVVVSERVDAAIAAMKKAEAEAMANEGLSNLLNETSLLGLGFDLGPMRQVTLQFTSTVFAGRRSLLTTDAKERLREANERYAKFGVKIRTYDLLIDSAASLEHKTLVHRMPRIEWL
jgi:hypothetical protein